MKTVILCAALVILVLARRSQCLHKMNGEREDHDQEQRGQQWSRDSRGAGCKELLRASMQQGSDRMHAFGSRRICDGPAGPEPWTV